jgi:predicted unusual protein kinase regulating ubiquinone biosynthesis (AarF/ABC1/UbiB family)
MPTIAELMKAFPEERGEFAGLSEPFATAAMRPVPVGRLRRMGLMGALQAKIAAAYLFYWIRGWFHTADEKERLLAETHWRTAVRLLDSMSYLRGAAMKLGQTLANFPDVVPMEFVDTLDQLHYTAPPMHWSLMREMVHNELGDDPENLFASFEKRAFAAASLGQVHGAQLKSGENVAVKIQYPGIARTIGEDFRNLSLFLLAGRLDKDWEHLKNQMNDTLERLQQETDYEAEAAMLMRAGPLFREADGIVVPKVYPQLSTARVLTMERIEGIHLDKFLQRKPSQELRNEVARKILRAWYRLYAAGRMFYADFHPGNFLVQEDATLGVIDFGFILPLDSELSATFGKMDQMFLSGRQDEVLAAIKEWSWITDDPADSERLRLCAELANWYWRPFWSAGEYDFSDEADFRRGFTLFSQMVTKRYTRARPCTPVISRQQFSGRSILYRLKAKIDVRAIMEEELRG